METTVSNSVLRLLALQLVLLIAAVRGQPWCSLDLNIVEPGSEEVEFRIITVTCDSNNNPEVEWIANGDICWGYSCNDSAPGLVKHCAGGGSFSTSAKVVLEVANETQCSYYPCIRSDFLDYRVNYTVSCPADNNPQPTATITSSTASLQYSNSTAVTTPSHTPDLTHHQATSTHQTLTLSSSASSATTTIASETIASKTSASESSASKTSASDISASKTSARETSASDISASKTSARETSTISSVITSEVTTQHTMKITLTTLIPSTMPSTQAPTDAPTESDTQIIVLSASILGVLLIVLLIVLLCSTMFKRYYRNWQHKIVFDGGMPDWEPFDTIVTLSISISTLTEPLEKYETKIQMDTMVPENDDESDITSSISSASEILGEPVKDFSRHHSNSEYVQVVGAQSAWDNSGSDQCSTLAATSSGYLEYQGSIRASHRKLEYSSSVETTDENLEYHVSNELVETSDGYLRQQDNQAPSTSKDHHDLVATSSGYVQYRDSNETSDNSSNENSGGYLHYQDIHETSYQLAEEFVRTSGGYVQYKDCTKETTFEQTEYPGLAESISEYIDNKDTSCGHMPYQELVDISGGYIDSKATICRHMPYQELVDSSGGYTDSKDTICRHMSGQELVDSSGGYTDGNDTSCGHLPSQGLVDNSGGYIDSSYQQHRELVESSGGYVHYKDSQIDTSCRQIHYQDLVQSDNGYIHYQDSNGYLHTNPI